MEEFNEELSWPWLTPHFGWVCLLIAAVGSNVERLVCEQAMFG